MTSLSYPVHRVRGSIFRQTMQRRYMLNYQDLIMFDEHNAHFRKLLDKAIYPSCFLWIVHITYLI